jgi:hypothetical protein
LEAEPDKWTLEFSYLGLVLGYPLFAECQSCWIALSILAIGCSVCGVSTEFVPDGNTGVPNFSHPFCEKWELCGPHENTSSTRQTNSEQPAAASHDTPKSLLTRAYRYLPDCLWNHRHVTMRAVRGYTRGE